MRPHATISYEGFRKVGRGLKGVPVSKDGHEKVTSQQHSIATKDAFIHHGLGGLMACGLVNQEDPGVKPTSKQTCNTS